jgi:hypothetical protein
MTSTPKANPDAPRKSNPPPPPAPKGGYNTGNPVKPGYTPDGAR